MSAVYVPVFKSILGSTIWGEASHVRVVWLTMLMLKGRDGFVGYSVPGLMREAVVSREQCEDALAVLMAPDPDSKSKEYEGRRLVAVDGGWLVVNHKKYYDLVTESGRERVRKFRERQKETGQQAVTDVTLHGVTSCFPIDVDVDSSLSGSSLSSDASPKKKSKRQALTPVPPPDSFVPTPATLKTAEKHRRNWETDWEDCRDHHLKKGNPICDWQAALRTWLSRANGFEKSGLFSASKPAPANHRPPQPNADDDRDRYVARRLNETDEQLEARTAEIRAGKRGLYE